jgi:hypothetical protein
MFPSFFWRTAAILTASVFAPAIASEALPPQNCNEGCLLKIASQYMDALTANDPSSVPLAIDIRSTENGIDTPLTKGIWTTAVARSYRHTFVDPVSGQIGAFGTVREGADMDAMLAIRLKVVDRKITESELLVTRKGDFSLYEPMWAAEAKPMFKAIVPEEHRSTRTELAAIPMKYFRAIMAGDPELVPVHPDAVRVENGSQTTSSPNRAMPSISEGLRRLVYMQSVRQVRVPVIDTTRGFVLAIVAFDLPKMNKTITVRGKPIQITSEARNLPRTLELYELFKVEDGLITGIEAVMRNAPFGTDMGWGGQ